MPNRKIGRLAMRVEGDNWVAYYAMTDTMEGAVLLGSTKMATVQKKERKDQFMQFMRDVVSDILEEKFGERPDWHEPQTAPEHERSGSA